MSFPTESQNGILWHPGVNGNAEEITVEMYHVRAAGDLIVSFDFPHNEWVIKMEPTRFDDQGSIIDYEEPVEVARLPAFYEPPRPDEEDREPRDRPFQEDPF